MLFGIEESGSGGPLTPSDGGKASEECMRTSMHTGTKYRFLHFNEPRER